MSEFMTLQKLKKENIPEQEYFSFHYKRLVAIQERFFTSEDSEAYGNFSEIHLKEFHDIVQVAESTSQIVKAWEKCKEYDLKKSEEEEKQKLINEKLSMKICDEKSPRISERLRNCLQISNHINWADVCIQSKSDMLKYKNLGISTVNELERVITKMGLHFNMKCSSLITQ